MDSGQVFDARDNPRQRRAAAKRAPDFDLKQDFQVLLARGAPADDKWIAAMNQKKTVVKYTTKMTNFDNFTPERVVPIA